MNRPHPIRALSILFNGLAGALADRQVRLLLSLTVGLITVATVFYHLVEGWAVIDAAYFSTVTIATVGYGDFVPETVPGKLFTIVYVIVGIGLFVAAATAIADRLIQRAREHERLLRRQERARRGREPRE
ncbi:MAG: potassium channel family protein [Pseudomonadota bacterium]